MPRRSLSPSHRPSSTKAAAILGVLALLLLSAGCPPPDVAGDDAGASSTNGDDDAGGGSVGGDAGPELDAGGSADAGGNADAGGSADAGEHGPDAGESSDGGQQGADGGTPEDDGGTQGADGGVIGCDPIPVWYLDDDGDGFGDPDVTASACTQPDGYASVAESPVELSLDRETLSLPLGTGARVFATLHFNSGRTDDVTGEATWSSDAPSLVRVGSGPLSGGVVDALALGSAVVRAQHLDLEATLSVDATAAVVNALHITPAQTTAIFGSYGVFFDAFATYSDGTVVDVTQIADWSCPDVNIGSLGNVSYAEWEESELNGMPIELHLKGHFDMGTYNYHVDPPIALQPGTATITATLDGYTATARLVVTDASLDIVRIDYVPPILLDTSVRLSLWASYDSGLQRTLTDEAQWSSSDPSIISVVTTPEGDVFATAHQPGSVTLTACVGAICHDQLVEVNARVLSELRIISDNADVLLGVTTRMKAILVYADGLQQDATSLLTEWSFTGADDVAAVAYDGTVGFSVYEGGWRNAWTVRGLRTGALAVTVTLPTSPDTSISTTRVFPVRPPQLVSLEVTPQTRSIPVFAETRLRAIGTFEDGSIRDVSTQALWLADDATIALPAGLDADGAQIVGVTGGATTVTATAGAFSASASIEVIDEIQSIELVAVHPETLEPYEPPFMVGSTLQFLARATLASGAVADLPLDGFSWDIPHAGNNSYDERWVLANLGPGLFRVQELMAQEVTARIVLDNGHAYSASYVVNSELDAPRDLIIDPPNPGASWNGAEVVESQYFKIYLRYKSGRQLDVTGAALSVVIDPHDDVDLGANPEPVAVPGEVVESTFWELVDIAPGFLDDPDRYPDISAALGRPKTNIVRRFDAPKDMRGRFDVTFAYEGVAATATMALKPSVFAIDFNIMLSPSLFGSLGNTEPERLVVLGMGDLLIKDINPTYSHALRMMESRAVARAADLDVASLTEALEAQAAWGNLSAQEQQDLVAGLTETIADPKARQQAALVAEFCELLLRPKASRSADENLAVTWLGQTVHDAQVASAEAALDEYNRWAEDAWSYVPPPGVDYRTPTPGPESPVWLYDMPAPPNLVQLAQAGVSPEVAAGATNATEIALIGAVVGTSTAVALGVAVTAQLAPVVAAIMPYAAIISSSALNAASIGGPLIIVTFVIMGAIQTVQIIEREAIPRRLSEILTTAKQAPVPDPNVLFQQQGGPERLIAALISRMY